MKIVVIGGGGLIGSKLVVKLREQEHESMAASFNSDVNSVTGDELFRGRLAALKDPRDVVADPEARYSGAKLSLKTLVPDKTGWFGETRFETWRARSALQIPGRPVPTK